MKYSLAALSAAMLLGSCGVDSGLVGEKREAEATQGQQDSVAAAEKQSTHEGVAPIESTPKTVAQEEVKPIGPPVDDGDTGETQASHESPRGDELVASCGKVPHGGKEMRSRFRAQNDANGYNCEPQIQERICTNGEWGAWSGSYEYSTCEQGAELLGACACSQYPWGGGFTCGGHSVVVGSEEVFLPSTWECQGEATDQGGFCRSGRKVNEKYSARDGALIGFECR